MNFVEDTTDPPHMDNTAKRTRVVHCKASPYDTYIGRGKGSIWGNPFTHHKDGTLAQFVVPTRHEAISRYREYIIAKIQSDPSMREAFDRDICHKTLGCWCKPLSCHGDVLADLADEVAKGLDPFAKADTCEEKTTDNGKQPRRSGPTPID